MSVISCGSLKRAYKISKGQTSEIDVDEELRKLLQKEIVNNINKVIEDQFPSLENKDKSGGLYSDSSGIGGGFSGRQGQLDIDLLVASVLVNGAQTTNILRNLFGLVPNLIGR